MTRFHILLWLVALGASGCSTPLSLPDAEFTGANGGCGRCFVYRSDATRTIAVTVSIDEAKINVANDSATIPIQNCKDVRVRAERFQWLPKDYYCQDYGTGVRPLEDWEAISGSIDYVRNKLTPPKEMPNATHLVSVVLRNVTFKSKKTGKVCSIPFIEMGEVWVGWSP